MDIQIINQKSKWLRAVQDLGDRASNTVGFLPREAYVPYKIGKLQIQGFSEPATQKIK